MAQLTAIAPTLAAYPHNGAFIDSCFVHEQVNTRALCGGASFACVSESCITGPSQNVDYCSGQSLPNCVGWNLFSVDWNGTSLTMDSAFALWYASLSSQWKKVGHVSAKALL
jgi:hypothetical protein